MYTLTNLIEKYQNYSADGKGNVVVGGLKEHVCLNKEEMLNVMKIGHSARATSKTEMNETR
jgi:hypothetical protein